MFGEIKMFKHYLACQLCIKSKYIEFEWLGVRFFRFPQFTYALDLGYIEFLQYGDVVDAQFNDEVYSP